MSRLLLSFLLIMLPLCSHCANESLLERLDSALAAKPEAIKLKQQHIDFLRSSIAKEKDKTVLLRLYENIYEQYYVYRFDKASSSLDKGLAFARMVNDTHYTKLFTIHKIELLSISGLYSESEKLAQAIDADSLEAGLRFDYYITLFKLYGYWADYCNDSVYSPRYRTWANNSLVKAMKYIPADTGLREYYMGEWATYIRHDPMMARKHYQKVLKVNKEDSRAYAMACFALAGNYRNNGGGEDIYEEYLIRAAISDARGLTMENFALQTLAIFLYQHGQGDIGRAQRYITQALDDAKFYNSRLRIIEISQDLPTIIDHYQAAIGKRNHNLKLALVAISFLVVVLLALLALFYRLNKRLNLSRVRLKRANYQLKDSNDRQEEMNARLSELNDSLRDTNKRREGLAKLFIDLCDKYITRLSKYQTLVKRKIKTGQVQQLLSQVTSSRLPEEDAEIFYRKFDEAFLALYPTFVSEFNNLLRDDMQVTPKQGGALTTDLRVFALIRLGVRESSEISNLLFYSPQTIYNYRSQMKSRAKSRDTFEDDVRQLCTVMQANT